MSRSDRNSRQCPAADQGDPAYVQRDGLAAAITDLFEARRLLARQRMGYASEDFDSSYFKLRAGQDKEIPTPSVTLLPSVPGAERPPVPRSRLKRAVLSFCSTRPGAMKALTWSAARLRATVTVARLAAAYPGSTDRIETKIQARDALVNGFPEALAGMQAVRACWRFMRRTKHRPPSSLPSPYNLEPFDARKTRTLYLHDILGDPDIAGDFQSALEQMLGHAVRHGRFQACVALNFHAGGGAENATLHYVDHYASRFDGSILLILTDPGPQKRLPPLPDTVFVLEIERFRGARTWSQREAILFNCLHALRPRLLHVVNSVTAWEFLHRMPPGFFPEMKSIASNFALQFADPERKIVVGYAATNLPRCMDKLDAVVTDNRRFAEEGIETLDLEAYREKVHVVYNPSRLGDVVSCEEAEHRLRARIADMVASPRLKIVWAGRLDEEKRIDLLLDTAGLCADFCDFHVYGNPVVSREDRLQGEVRSRANIFLHGAFASPLEWESDEIKHAFFFTSRWEGMPNVLVEAAYLGMPICAMDVGGVRELVGDETGWLLGERDGALCFAEVFKRLAGDPAAVEGRTRNLIRLVRAQHDRRSFAERMDRLMASLNIVGRQSATTPAGANGESIISGKDAADRMPDSISAT